MIVVRLKGGLGNQLFQYASALSLAMNKKLPLRMDVSFYKEQKLRGYKLRELNIDYSEKIIDSELPVTIKVIRNRYVNKTLRKLGLRHIVCSQNYIACLDEMPSLESINPCKNYYLDGYYQSEKYFSDQRENLLHQLTPKYDAEPEYEQILQLIRNCNSVAVHVRRGDFATQKDRTVGKQHYLLGERYYQNTLNYMANKVSSPEFFWFSDDIDWVKENFGNRTDFHFVHLNTTHLDIDELMLMKNCKHIITANSTFSWWAAWINENENAIKVCPARRYGNIDMIPGNWVKIAVE